MLTVEAYGPGGSAPMRTEATRVLVKDQYGNPLAVVVVYGDNQILVAHQNDDDFDILLSTFGVESAVVLKRLDVSGPRHAHP